MNVDTIEQIVDEHKHMWTDNKDEYVLVKVNERFQIYHIPTQSVYGAEVEEANQRIWANMTSSGVAIVDEFPSFLSRYIMMLKHWLTTRI